jgi:heat shock protein HslJ
MIRLIVLAALGGLIACAPAREEPAPKPAALEPPAASVPAALDLEWAVFEVAGAPVSARGPTIGFEDGRVFGFAGCNRYTGPVSFTGSDGIRVGAAAMTMMACADPQMDLEQRFAQALEVVVRWQVRDGVLLLMGADGSVLARARPAPPAP